MISNLTRSEPQFVPAMPMRTIEGSAAWQGLDLRNTGNFTHRLTDAEISEIDTAVQAIIQGRIDHIAIDRHNFKLPQLGKRLFLIRDDVLLRGRGFMVVRGLPVGLGRPSRRQGDGPVDRYGAPSTRWPGA